MSMLAENLTATAKTIYCDHFDAYRSNVCHLLHNLGDIEFIRTLIIEDTINQLVKANHGAWALYLLAMLDYVNKENGVPLCTRYDYLREEKLEKLYIPSGIRIGLELFKNQKVFDEAYENAIPEFLKHNFLEGDVRNVV